MDNWTGVETFFEPGREILVARSAEDILEHLGRVSAEQAREIGSMMRQRALRDHTYAQRAQEVDKLLAAARRRRTHEPSWATLDESPVERTA